LLLKSWVHCHTYAPGEDEDDIREEDWRKLSSEIDFSNSVICDDVLTT
jgi:hypothetical protein